MCLGVLLRSVRYRTRFYALSARLPVGAAWFIFSIRASPHICVCICACARVCACVCTFNGTLSNILLLSNGNWAPSRKVRMAVRLSGKSSHIFSVMTVQSDTVQQGFKAQEVSDELDLTIRGKIFQLLKVPWVFFFFFFFNTVTTWRLYYFW